MTSMTPDQQFQLQFWGLIFTSLITTLGMIFTYLKASAAKDIAQAGVNVAVANGKKSDESNTKLVEIHTLTNSNLSDAVRRLDVAMKEIAGLKDLVANMDAAKLISDRTAEHLAAKVAAVPTPRPARATDLVGQSKPTEVKIVASDVPLDVAILPDKENPLPVDVVEHVSKEKPKKLGQEPA